MKNKSEMPDEDDMISPYGAVSYRQSDAETTESTCYYNKRAEEENDASNYSQISSANAHEPTAHCSDVAIPPNPTHDEQVQFDKIVDTYAVVNKKKKNSRDGES